MKDATIEYLDVGPDGQGRRRFILRWVSEYGDPRGQVFNDTPPAGVPEHNKAVGLASYYPEMGEEKPAAEIEASLSHYGRHWFLWTPLELAGRGIERLGAEVSVDHRRAGWHRYKVTERAFDLLGKRYRIVSESLL